MYPGEGAATNRAIGVSGSSTRVAPESESAIRNQIGLAEQTLSEIQEQISFLEQRLDTALTPAPPDTGLNRDKSAPTPVQSHMMGRLVILTEGLQNAGTRLNALRMRVEI